MFGQIFGARYTLSILLLLMLTACGGAGGADSQQNMTVELEPVVPEDPVNEGGGDADPDNTQPDGSQPDGSQPDGSQPDGSQPDGSQPDDSQPDGSQPDDSQPEDSQPEEQEQPEQPSGEDGAACTENIWQSGKSYQYGDTVVNRGAIYECLVAGWCASSSDWAYEPGAGLYWGEAWALKEECTAEPPTTEPIPPNGVTAVVAVPSASQDRIGVSWSDRADNETGIKVYRAEGDGAFSLIAQLEQNMTTYTDLKVMSGHRYQYQVVPFNAAGDGVATKSDKVELDIPLALPDTPQLLDVVTENQSLKVRWQISNGSTPDQFHLYRQQNNSAWQYLQSVTGDTFSYVDEQMIENVQYGYRITAENTAGESEYSNVLFGQVSIELDGMQLFSDNCSLCHNPTGAGGDLFTIQMLSAWQDKHFQDLLAKIDTMPVRDCDQACLDSIAKYIWEDQWGLSIGDVEEFVQGRGKRGIRLLTPTEYQNTVRDLFNITLDDDDLPPARFDSDFKYDTQSERGILLTDDVLARMKLAENTAQRVSLSAMNCSSSGCTRNQITNLGLRIFRRPMTDNEITRYRDYGAEYGDQAMLASMLSSPYFLYRMEAGEWDAESESYKLNGYEVASFLSFVLWGTTPDQSLLTLAEQGQLANLDDIKSQVQAMVANDRFAENFTHFIQHYTQTFGPLGEKDGLNENLIAAMQNEQAEAIRFLLMNGDGTLNELFNPGYTFLNSALSDHYGVGNVLTTSAQKVATDTLRGGLLHHGLTQIHNSDFAATSLVKRGKMIRENMFCHAMGVPSGVDPATIEIPETPITTRERWDIITGPDASEGQCWQCHQLMNEPGSAMENYDETGRYRTHEEAFNVVGVEMAIDAMGVLRDNSGFNVLNTYSSLRELTEYMAVSNEVRDCFVDNFYRFSMGHASDQNTRSVLEYLQENFRSDGDILNLVTALVGSEVTLYRLD